MKDAPVYSFGEVLRGLRNEADVSVLQAQELTAYGNYERWESAQTRVGADHLDNIGAAFDVGNDLWRLVYAWLVDRFVPLPGCELVDISDVELRRQLSRLPQREVDLGEYADMALGPLTHTDVAVIGVIARYRWPNGWPTGSWRTSEDYRRRWRERRSASRTSRT